MNRLVKVSVAVPLPNEESVLPELISRVSAVLDALPGGPHEILFVDDGSADATWTSLSNPQAVIPALASFLCLATSAIRLPSQRRSTMLAEMLS